MPTPEPPTYGPCADWITAEDVAAVCTALDSSGDPSVYDTYATEASQILYAASGRQFSGVCGPVTARPCVDRCGCWVPGYGTDFGWSSWGGYWIGGGGAGVSAVQDCGYGCCGNMSRVKLSGYPVVEIVSVDIGGDTVPASDYRLDEWKFLTYLDDDDGNHRFWPSCQALARPAGDAGTFSVTYNHGVAPPLLGQEAAVQLACALAASSAECELPPGTTQIDRQGVRIQLALRPGELPPAFAGLPLVKAFLATVNPHGLTRRSAVYSFDGPKYAPKFGST